MFQNQHTDNDKLWMSEATRAELRLLDIGFVVSDSYYYGPDKDFTQEQWAELREPIPDPGIDKVHGYISFSSVEDDVGPVVEYYENVGRLAGKHRKPLGPRSPYTWIRPFISFGEKSCITCPWYDTKEEAESFLSSFALQAEGEIVGDTDQGWELVACVKGGIAYFHEWDPDYEQGHVSICCDYPPVYEAAKCAQIRLNKVIAQLHEKLGVNYW